MFHNVFDTIFVDETEVEVMTSRGCANAIEDRDHIRLSAHAVVANQSIRATAVRITVGTAVTFLLEFEESISAERQNLIVNVTVGTVFGHHNDIGSAQGRELEGMQHSIN